MTTNNPWKTLRTRSVYEDPWIRVRVDDVIRPDGSPGNYSVVEFKGGIGVVARDTEGRILLVGQYRYALSRYSWEIPKGAFSSFGAHEPALSTAKRELQEETGVLASNWKGLGIVHTLMGSTNDEVHLFSALIESQGAAAPDVTEVINVAWVECDEFWSMVARGEVTDATSIAAVALALR